jgi:hypothetical protein
MFAEIHAEWDVIEINEDVFFPECGLQIIMDSPYGSLTVFVAIRNRDHP